MAYLGHAATHDFAGRRRRLGESLAADGLCGTVASAPSNIRWLTGLVASAGAVLVRPDGSAVLATDHRYLEAASGLEPDGALEMLASREPIADLLRGLDASVAEPVGLDGAHLSHRTVTTATQNLDGWVDDAGRVERLRMTKDATEVALIEGACAITEEAMLAVVADLRVGTTERQAARAFTSTIVDRGADGPAFPPIVAFGPHTSRPHHVPTERALERGDLVLLDVGAELEGYCADTTRTFAFGDPGEQLRGVHREVVAAQSAGRAAVRAGVEAGGVDAIVRAALDRSGWGRAFTHGTGHGIGLDVHEAPILRAGAPAILGTSFTVTVEPGVYLPGVGGVRVEDLLLVGPEEAESLTRLPRDLVVL